MTSSKYCFFSHVYNVNVDNKVQEMVQNNLHYSYNNSNIMAETKEMNCLCVFGKLSAK